MIGATLVLGLLGSVAWSITLAAASLLYGAVGVFVLGVQLDYALLAGERWCWLVSLEGLPLR